MATCVSGCGVCIECRAACDSSATSYAFLVVSVYGRFMRLFNFLLRYLAVLYDGACMLFTTRLIGSFSLCVFMYTMSFGFMFIRYFCVCLPVSVLHF